MKRSSFGRLLLALSTAVALDAPAAAQTAGANYAIDPVHSSAEFKVEHLVISNVRGTIPVVSGSFEVPAGSTLPVNAAATLDAAALTTQNPDRDADLRGADWFDVAKYPTILFRSTKIVAGAAGNFSMTGDLTLHGVTKSVVLACGTVGSGVDGRGHRRIGYSATTTIDRRDFGMTAMKATPGGNLIAGTSVAISLEVEVVER